MLEDALKKLRDLQEKRSLLSPRGVEPWELEEILCALEEEGEKEQPKTYSKVVKCPQCHGCFLVPIDSFPDHPDTIWRRKTRDKAKWLLAIQAPSSLAWELIKDIAEGKI